MTRKYNICIWYILYSINNICWFYLSKEIETFIISWTFEKESIKPYQNIREAIIHDLSKGTLYLHFILIFLNKGWRQYSRGKGRKLSPCHLTVGMQNFMGYVSTNIVCNIFFEIIVNCTSPTNTLRVYDVDNIPLIMYSESFLLSICLLFFPSFIRKRFQNNWSKRSLNDYPKFIITRFQAWTILSSILLSILIFYRRCEFKKFSWLPFCVSLYHRW